MSSAPPASTAAVPKRSQRLATKNNDLEQETGEEDSVESEEGDEVVKRTKRK